jgi:hypothetical protein
MFKNVRKYPKFELDPVPSQSYILGLSLLMYRSRHAYRWYQTRYLPICRKLQKLGSKSA